MKILWVKTDFLHPTTRGGQIRTLEMLRQLHRRHEIHYVALDDGRNPEGLRRSGEYSTRAYAVPHESGFETFHRFCEAVGSRPVFGASRSCRAISIGSHAPDDFAAAGRTRIRREDL